MSKANPKIKNRQVQKTSTTQIFWVGLASTCILSLGVYFAVFLSTTQPETAVATVNYALINDNLNNGQLVCAYTFDQGDVLLPDVGVKGIFINEHARCLPGGKNGSMGIGSVNKKGDIGLVLKNS